MMKTKVYQIAFVMLFMLMACGSGISDREISPEKQEYYEQSKSKFRPELINHFPDKLASEVGSVESHLDAENNNVSLLLFEYELSAKQIEAVRDKVKSMNGVKEYNTIDSNLLLVIPNKPEFEQNEAPKNNPNVNATGSLPIIDLGFYSSESSKFDQLANGQYEVYVLEAKPEKVTDFPALPPNRNMPAKWQNGISKGVSINKKDKMVVFWTVIW